MDWQPTEKRDWALEDIPTEGIQTPNRIHNIFIDRSKATGRSPNLNQRKYPLGLKYEFPKTNKVAHLQSVIVVTNLALDSQ